MRRDKGKGFRFSTVIVMILALMALAKLSGSAESVMNKDPVFRFVFLFASCALVLLLVVYLIIKILLRYKREKRQQDIDILNADIGALGKDEAEKRAEKYVSGGDDNSAQKHGENSTVN